MQLTDLTTMDNYTDYYNAKIQQCTHSLPKHDLIRGITAQSPVSWIYDIGALASNLKQWKRSFPKVQPLFSLEYSRMNFLPLVRDMGVGFTCTSKRDLLASDSAGVKPTSVLFDNEGKPKSNMRAAVEGGSIMVVRNEKDINQIAASDQAPTGARIVVEVSGMDMNNCCHYKKIAEKAGKKGLKIIGVRFDCSDCQTEAELEAFVNQAVQFMTYMESVGHPMELVDLGRVSCQPNGEAKSQTNCLCLTAKINSMLESHLFTKWPQITVTGDASSCIMRTALSVVVTVASVETNPSMVECTINDSIYGSFSGTMADCDALAREQPWVVYSSLFTDNGANPKVDGVIKGCVNDDYDVLNGVFELPENVTGGDMLVFEGMGQIVTNATLEAINFNCLIEPQIDLYIHEDNVNLAKEMRCKAFSFPEGNTSFQQCSGRLDRVMLEHLIQNMSLSEQQNQTSAQTPINPDILESEAPNGNILQEFDLMYL